MKKINLNRYKNFVENIIFILSLILAYIIQTSCKLEFIYNKIPISILAIVLSIAMFKDIFLSCVYSLFAGILCDMALNIQTGVSCLFFVVFSSIISWLTIYYLKANLSSFMLFIFIFVLLESLIVNMFKHHAINFFARNIISFVVITYLISLPIFLFFYYINNCFSDKDIFFNKK